MYNCKIVDKRYYLYILFLIPVFIVQVTKLVQFIMFENSVNISALCNSCEDMACCSSECVLMFLYVAITSSMLTSSLSRVSTFFYTSLFIKPHKQKSNGVKSGDLGGQLMVLP